MGQGTGSASPSPHQLRAELEAMVLGDLLGPAGGEDEELTERTVRDRYLVGVLAPSRSGATTARPTAEDDENEDTPLIPDELSEGGSDTADDGTTDADIPLAQAFLPSSFGLTFCVDDGEPSIQVAASWGQYKRFPEEVVQGLHDKKKPKSKPGKKEAKANTQAGPSLFHEEDA